MMEEYVEKKRSNFVMSCEHNNTVGSRNVPELEVYITFSVNSAVYSVRCMAQKNRNSSGLF